MHQLLFWISLWDILITFPAIQAMNKEERKLGGKKLDSYASKTLLSKVGVTTTFLQTYLVFSMLFNPYRLRLDVVRS